MLEVPPKLKPVPKKCPCCSWRSRTGEICIKTAGWKSVNSEFLRRQVKFRLENVFVMVSDRGGQKSSSGTLELAKGLLYQLSIDISPWIPNVLNYLQSEKREGDEIGHPA